MTWCFLFMKPEFSSSVTQERGLVENAASKTCLATVQAPVVQSREEEEDIYIEDRKQ